MRVIYIAGPFRGASAWEIEQNVRRAEEASLLVWRAGAAALCPHTNTRFFQGAAPDEVWLEGTLELLRRCDAILLVHGWKKSSGAKAERKEALIRSKYVFYQEKPEELPNDLLAFIWEARTLLQGVLFEE